MTLVELLVVLAILAVLTTVAVTSSDVVLSQGRYEATTRTLAAIEQAVLGPQSAVANSDEPAAGFLADLGRLPRYVNESGQSGIGLAELWSIPGPPATMEGYQIYRATVDSEVAVGCGWRGPYLRLSAGRSDLLDGWGRTLDLLNAAGNPALPGEEIFTVRSRGEDGLAETSDDLLLALGSRAGISVAGNVYRLDGDGQRQNPALGDVRIMFYTPDGNRGLLSAQSINAALSGNTSVVSYNLTTTAGPRSLRAYMGDPASTSTTVKSKVTRIQHGGVVDIEMR